MPLYDKYVAVHQENIERCYFNDERPTGSERGIYQRFLPVGCSGGGGHNTAILAFTHFFQPIVQQTTPQKTTTKNQLLLLVLRFNY